MNQSKKKSRGKTRRRIPLYPRTPTMSQALMARTGRHNQVGGWFDDFADYAKDLVPYYRKMETILDNPISKSIIKHAPKLVQKGANFLFPEKTKNQPLAMKNMVKSEVKSELKNEGLSALNDKNVIFGPSKSVSYQASPSLAKRNGATWLTGGELHSVISAGSGGFASGDLIKSIDLNPATINLPVLRSHIKTFEQFWFKRLTVTLVGGSGNNATGTFVLVYDPDPRDQWTVSSAEMAKRATNAKYKTIARPFDVSHLEIPSRSKPLLYIDNELGQERFESIGHMAIVCLNPIAANTPIGALYFSYEVELITSQTDPDITGGDFLAINCSGSFSTSAMLNAGTQSSYSSIQLTSWTEEDQKKGYINLPAGSYRVGITIGGGTAAAYDNSLWTVVQSGQYAPWYDTVYQSIMDTTGSGFSQDRWCGCLSPFRVRLNMSAGTWSFANIWISGVSANPYTSGQKSLFRLQALMDTERGTEKSLAKYKSDTLFNEGSRDWLKITEQDVSEDRKEAKERTSTSSSSTSSLSVSRASSTMSMTNRKY